MVKLLGEGAKDKVLELLRKAKDGVSNVLEKIGGKINDLIDWGLDKAKLLNVFKTLPALAGELFRLKNSFASVTTGDILSILNALGMGADIDPDIKSKLNDAFEIDENVLTPILNVNFRSLHFSLSAYNKYVCGVIDSI